MFFKKHWWAILYSVMLISFTLYCALDTFVIERVYEIPEQPVSSLEGTSSAPSVAYETDTKAASGSETERQATSQPEQDTTAAQSLPEQTEPSVTANSYTDQNISVQLTQYRYLDTDIYVADITLSSPEYLKTALANGKYGKNVTAKTSDTAASVGAILAINGDYYGARESGYVIRNGILYRSTPKKGGEALVIYSDGSMQVVNEDEVTAEELLQTGAYHVFSFGPSIVQNGSVSVGEGYEVGQAMASNPRTAIGIIDGLHYVFIVSDGRTSESAGLSLYELGTFIAQLGVKTAYNLDGGGSSTMVFNNEIVNYPTTNGRTEKERSVSDIVYIGY